jgi:hypothetical protein
MKLATDFALITEDDVPASGRNISAEITAIALLCLVTHTQSTAGVDL